MDVIAVISTLTAYALAVVLLRRMYWNHMKVKELRSRVQELDDRIKAKAKWPI